MALPLAEFLVKRGKLKKDEAERFSILAQREQKTLEDFLLEKGIIGEKDLFLEKSAFLNIPLKEISVGEIPPFVLEEVSEDFARRYRVVPLNKRGNVLEIGMVFPEDLRARSAIEFITKPKGIRTEIYLIYPSQFEEALKRYGELKKEIGEVLEELEKEREEKEKPEKLEAEKIEEAPVAKMTAVILRHAVEGGASDIHIEPFGNHTRVRYRVDGVLHSSLLLEKRFLPSIVSRIKILSNLRIDETRVPQDGRFHATILGRKIDFRVGTFPTAQGEKVVIRVLDPRTAVRSITELGLQGRNLSLIQKASELPFGLLVFCGPTGCGKTTTQYAIIRELNEESVNIVTLEDPVEYWIDGISQSQVRPEIGYTFANGLRQILRQDPDIIMVGEIRDRETAELVVHAALTGHLVLSTLHTNDAVGAIPRLLDMGVDNFLLPAALKVVVAQRLIRKLCPKCKIKTVAKGSEEKLIKEQIADLPEEEKKMIPTSPPFYLYRPKGCPSCANKGTKGRIGIFEILVMTSELEEIILKNPSEGKIKEEAKRQKMITMLQDGVIKALQGIVSLEEVLKTVETQTSLI